MFLINETDAAIFPMARTGDMPKMLGWNLPADQQHLVHEHWKDFPAPPYYMHLLLAMIYFVLMNVSLIGNGIVVWIFSTSKSLRNGSNMFVVNLAIFDLLMMCEMPMFLVNSFAGHLVGFETGCAVYAALGSLSGIGGSITNAVIAYDRYRTISNPLDGRLNRVQCGILIFITWLWAMPFTLLPVFKIWGRYIPEGFLTTCSFDYLTDDSDTRVFVGCIFTWAYVIPMILICYFYGRLFGHVSKHELMLKNQARKMNVESLAANRNEKAQSVEMRIARAAFTIFFLFVCAWTPYAIVTMIGAFGDRTLLTPFFTMIPAVCAKIVSCLDPWVYAISHPKYRQELERRLPWMGIKEPGDNISTTDSKQTVVSDSVPMGPNGTD
ncbi:opsin-3 [Aedes albopictus]|uniref:G-protein coupled receptors family 1 profile domain-containing protein n=1 Tax=Aedes albopictus TaxID=7160 RepID=A0ABM1Y7J4_AEDAL